MISPIWVYGIEVNLILQNGIQNCCLSYKTQMNTLEISNKLLGLIGKELSK